MLLSEVMGAGTAPDVEITGLAYDSRSVAQGTLFFCVTGLRSDGHEHAPEAVAAGAAALVVERPLGLRVPEVQVDSARAAMAQAAARFHGKPTERLRVVGITGTNGKTTTAFLLRELLEAAGTQCGLLGTVTSIVGGQELPVERTTPEAIDLHATFAAMLEAGDEACVMEVSSHALVLHRADAIHFEVAVFTNLTQDHLDFHPDMEDYFQAKRLLFAARPGVAIVNADDAYGRRLADEFPDATTFALANEADYRASSLRTGLEGSRFSLHTPDGALEDVLSPLPGRFNVSNALAATAAARALGVPLETIGATLERAGRVPGRFESVREGQGFAVLVDYAHTPDSLDNVLRAARDLIDSSESGGGANLVCVFGCGGDRDRGKRPLMGRIAADRADRVIVTSDNPRSEDPAKIIAEILDGAGDSVEVEPERRSAIARAVQGANPGDVVVIAGKGHEQGQEFADGRVEPFDDVVVAREALRGRAAAAAKR